MKFIKMSVSFSVSIEETGEIVVLNLSPEDAEKAQWDHEFLKQLVNEELSRGSNDKSPFIWTTNCINLLLALYEDNIERFESGSQRHNKIWVSISTAMQKKKYNVTWTQYQSKLNGLKKTYKKFTITTVSQGTTGKPAIVIIMRMDEIFGSSGWVQPKAVATEAGPKASSSTCSDEINSNRSHKKRKASIDIETYLAKMKEEKKVATEAKQRHREEMMRAKNEKVIEILKQKKEQHQEKMAMMK
ncbi:hypothetical protein PV326_014126, partial [Microctonus aethiopoides]